MRIFIRTRSKYTYHIRKHIYSAYLNVFIHSVKGWLRDQRTRLKVIFSHQLHKLGSICGGTCTATEHAIYLSSDGSFLCVFKLKGSSFRLPSHTPGYILSKLIAYLRAELKQILTLILRSFSHQRTNLLTNLHVRWQGRIILPGNLLIITFIQSDF